MAADGADLIDVGGESTRPGAERVPAEEEARRVLPVIRRLAAAGVPVSVDTYRAAVAEQALAAGARIVNDVSGGLGDPDMARVVRDAGCPWVLMHWRGHSKDMNALALYDDVVADVRDRAARPGWTGRWRPAWRPSSWCSIRDWALPRGPNTTGRCWPGSTR